MACRLIRIAVLNFEDNIDLYGILGVEKDANHTDIKKAYRKAALSSHPDKVPPERREEAEVQFKALNQAYEILNDDEKRNVYDTHGMSAFTSGPSYSGEDVNVDLDDILEQMFGGHVPGARTGHSRRYESRRSKDEERDYKVTLEDLYKGKTTRFASTKIVTCSSCKGSGGKSDAKLHKCFSCEGKGERNVVRQVGPGLAFRSLELCSACDGSGKVIKEKHRCKKCNGRKVTETRKPLELYIPPGSQNGDRIILEGETDQIPGQTPGDIIFRLVEVPHKTFRRVGSDLFADFKVSLSEALTGFDRTLLIHLDGHGVKLSFPKSEGRVLKPGHILKIFGEGMPIKGGDGKGDLYLTARIIFPEDGWLSNPASRQQLRKLLPVPSPPDAVTEAREVEYDDQAHLHETEAGAESTSSRPDSDSSNSERINPACAPQ